MPRNVIVTLIAIVVLGILAAILIPNSFYTVDETGQAIVLRFGEFQRESKSPGLHPKIPFVEQAVKYDDRVLRFDAPPASLITKDKKFLVIDAYGRYKIVNPKRFFETLRDVSAANARLGDIIIGELRKQIALFDQTDIIQAQRDAIVTTVKIESSRKTDDEFGIEIVDVRMKRSDFPPEIAQSVYARMVAERQQVAAKFRAQGAENDFRIRADADRQRAVILATATKHAEVVRGCGDAVAVKIFADAFNRDPEFFAFVRTLEAYSNFLSQNATVVLDANSELFRYLDNPAGLLNGELPTGLPPINQQSGIDTALLTQEQIDNLRLECETAGLRAAGLLEAVGTVENILLNPTTGLVAWAIGGQQVVVTDDSDLSGLEGTDAEVLIGRTDLVGLEDSPAIRLRLTLSLKVNRDGTLAIDTVVPSEG